MMDSVERLLAMEAIRVVKARYFRGLDSRDWALLGSVFAADAVFDTREALGNAKLDEEGADPFRESGLLQGRSGIVDALSALGSLASVMVHHGHMEEIEILGPRSARAIWAMDDRVEWPEGAAPLRSLRGFGHYHDDFVRDGEQWMIKYSRLTRLHVHAR